MSSEMLTKRYALPLHPYKEANAVMSVAALRYASCPAWPPGCKRECYTLDHRRALWAASGERHIPWKQTLGGHAIHVLSTFLLPHQLADC